MCFYGFFNKGVGAIESVKDFQPGYQFGHYTLQHKLGAGSMGVVYAAQSPKYDKLVALKILPLEFINDSKAIRRFEREADVSVRLSHPHLVQGYEWGKEQDIIFFAMEYLEGESLKKALRSQMRYDPKEALNLILPLARAVHYIGEQGVVHRDIKPENIMITTDGQVKLCDLGLVKSEEEQQDRLTVIGTVLGSPNYMSPEQASGENVDIRTDIYSLGVTFFQMITGVPPFTGKTATEILAKHIREDPPLANDLLPHLDVRYAHLLDKMMAKKTEDRYSPQELIEDLERLQKDEEINGVSTRVSKALEQLVSALGEYRFAYVPTREDCLYAKTLAKNKALPYHRIREALDYQEQLAQGGISLDFLEVCQELSLLAPEKAKIVRKTLEKHIRKEDEMLLLRIGLDEGYYDEEALQKLLKYQQEKEAENIFPSTTELLTEQIKLNPAQIQELQHLFNVKKGSREDNLFADLAVEAQFLSAGQLRKCFKIQANAISLGNYKTLMSVMVRKKFMDASHERVILRSIRRSSITGESPFRLIQELSLQEPKKSLFAVHWESLALEGNKQDILVLFKKAESLKNEFLYEEAKEVLDQILQIDFELPKIRTFLDSILEIQSNAVDFMYEGGRAFDRQNYERAIRFWEKALKIYPQNERMQQKLQEAKRYLGNVREKMRLGTKLYEEKKYKKAYPFFLQVLELVEKHPEAKVLAEQCKTFLEKAKNYKEKAEFYFQEKRYKEAKTAYENALQYHGEDADIPLLLKKINALLHPKKSLPSPEQPQEEEKESISSSSLEKSEDTSFVSSSFSKEKESLLSEESDLLVEEASVFNPHLVFETRPFQESNSILLKEEVMDKDKKPLTPLKKEEELAKIYEESFEKTSSTDASGTTRKIAPLEPLSPHLPSHQKIDTSLALHAFDQQNTRFLKNTSSDSPVEATPLQPLETTESDSHSLKKDKKLLLEPLNPAAHVSKSLPEEDIPLFTKSIFQTGQTQRVQLKEVEALSLGTTPLSALDETSTPLTPLSPDTPSDYHRLSLEEEIPSLTKSIFQTGNTLRITPKNLEAISLASKSPLLQPESEEESYAPLDPATPATPKNLKAEDEIPHMTQRVFRTDTQRVSIPLEPIPLEQRIPLKSKITGEEPKGNTNALLFTEIQQSIPSEPDSSALQDLPKTLDLESSLSNLPLLPETDSIEEPELTLENDLLEDPLNPSESDSINEKEEPPSEEKIEGSKKAKWFGFGKKKNSKEKD